MNDISKTFGGADAPTMSSREIASLVGSRHDKVKQSIERMVERGVIAQPPMGDEPETDALGRTRVTRVYLFSGEQGKRDSIVVVAQLSPEFTAHLVDRWQALEARLSPAFMLSDPATLRNLLLENVEKVLALEARAQQDAPKVAFADQVAVTPDTISLAEAAKLLGTGRTRLAAKLREMRWCTRRMEPYQDKIEARLLDVKLSAPFEHPDKGLTRSVTTVVTGKGLARLHKILGVPPAGQLPLDGAPA